MKMGFLVRVRTPLSCQSARIRVSAAFIETFTNFTPGRSSARIVGYASLAFGVEGAAGDCAPLEMAARLSVLTLQKSSSDTDRVSGEAVSFSVLSPKSSKLPLNSYFGASWEAKPQTRLLRSLRASPLSSPQITWRRLGRVGPKLWGLPDLLSYPAPCAGPLWGAVLPGAAGTGSTLCQTSETVAVVRGEAAKRAEALVISQLRLSTWQPLSPPFPVQSPGKGRRSVPSHLQGSGRRALK